MARIQVEMPDGTIIDAPEGVTKKQIQQRYQASQSQRQFADASPVSRENYPGLGAERQPIEGPSLGTSPQPSPLDKMMGGYLENAQQTAGMLRGAMGESVYDFFGLPDPKNIFNPNKPPTMDLGRDFYPMGFAPGEMVPLTGKTPKQLLPMAVGGAVQTVFPPARALGALGEIGWNTLMGVTGETLTDAGLRALEGEDWSSIGMDVMDELPGRTGEYLAGSSFAKGLGYFGEAAFGRPASESGRRAVEFARRNQNVGSEARAVGSPRIPVDAVTEGKFPGLIRSLLLGEYATNVKARQAATWINDVLKGSAKFKLVRLPSGQTYSGVPTHEDILVDTARFYTDLVGKQAAKPFIGETAGKAPSQWINELFTPKGAQRLELLKQMDPDRHALLLARYLSDKIEKYTRTDKTYGRIVDGQRLSEFVDSNIRNFKQIYGDDIAENIQNFANYAKYLDEPISKAIKAGKEGITMNEIGRAAVETGLPAAFLPSPGVAIPVQGYAWGLSHSLMDPNSFWFKLFQALPGTNQAVQQAARTGVAIGTDNDSE